MVHVIVETTHAPSLNEDIWSEAYCKLTPCLELRNARRLRTLLSLDRRRTICELEATDAESVRESYRAAGLPFDRVWTAEIWEA